MHRSGKNAVQISPSDDLRPPPGLSGGSRRRPGACRRDAIKGSSFWFLAVPLAFKKGADEKSPGLPVPKHKTGYSHRHFIAFPTALFALEGAQRKPAHVNPFFGRAWPSTQAALPVWPTVTGHAGYLRMETTSA